MYKIKKKKLNGANNYLLVIPLAATINRDSNMNKV